MTCVPSTTLTESVAVPTAADLSIGACLAGVRTALGHVEAAGAAVLSEDPAERAKLDMAVEAANAAIRRSLAMAVCIREEMPGHARRARLTTRAIERVTEALSLVQRLSRVPFDDDDGEAIHQAMIGNAIGKAERAIAAARP